LRIRASAFAYSSTDLTHSLYYLVSPCVTFMRDVADKIGTL